MQRARPGLTSGQAEEGLRRQLRQLFGGPDGPLHQLGLPADIVLRSGVDVEVEDERKTVLGEVTGHHRGRRDLVDGHVAGRRVFRVRRVRKSFAGKVVVDGLGKDLRTPTCPPERVSQPQGMGADVIVLEGGDELVDGHSLPSRHGHGPVGVPAAPGAPSVSRTAVTR